MKECLNKAGLRVLWVGRMLHWKRVDTIVRAVARVKETVPIALTLVGDGPEKARLVSLAERLAGDVVTFHPPVAINEVRELMRAHEVYVLASDAMEGWGAVVSEAMTEGMCVVGTREAGASAALLPEEHLFTAGNWRELAKILERLARLKAEGEELPRTPLPYAFTPAGAAERLVEWERRK